MSTILIKDSLRQSVEAASGGEQTVIYTAKGQPTFVNILKKFDLSTISSLLSGTHPAFIINGIEKDQLFIGTYNGVVKNGEYVSQPNQSVTHTMTYDQYLAYVRANGAGHHLMTNAEWSAIALQCFKNSTQPLGNNYYGRSSEDATQFGRREDGLDSAAGILTGTPRTLTGSGPTKWRHNAKYSGITDLAGNVNEFCSGLRIINGELQIIENNNAALVSIDLSATSGEWKAIHAETGALLTPNGLGTTEYSVKLANTGSADYTLVFANLSSFSGMTNPSLTKPVLAAALAKLRALCIFPIATSGLGNDAVSIALSGERLLMRSGNYSSGVAAGVFYLDVGADRAFSRPTVAARPCYYLP